MKFNDFALGAGIQTRRQHDTDNLARAAIELCASMLHELRSGTPFVEHGLEGVPSFGVSLNAPQFLQERMGEIVEAPDRIFCVGRAGEPPFQYNLVLPPYAATNRDRRACATILGIAIAGVPESDRDAYVDSTGTVIEELIASRPLLATALLPTTNVDVQTLRLGADFCTCFAAAMLLEA